MDFEIILLILLCCFSGGFQGVVFCNYSKQNGEIRLQDIIKGALLWNLIYILFYYLFYSSTMIQLLLFISFVNPNILNIWIFWKLVYHNEKQKLCEFLELAEEHYIHAFPLILNINIFFALLIGYSIFKIVFFVISFIV